MAELTVALRAHNVAPYIARAIDSALAQKDVDFEIIVIDDGSTDATAATVRSMFDSKITLLENTRPRGAGFCYHLALERSRSDFLATFDGDGVVLPGAFGKLLRLCRSKPTIGMAHCYHLEIDGEGNLTREQFRLHRTRLQNYFTDEVDYRRILLCHGDAAAGLHMYRRTVFESVGSFDQSMAVETDYDMALKIADRFDIELVPEYLYWRRILDRRSHESKARQFFQWARRAVHCRRLARAKAIGFLENSKRTRKLLLLGLCDALGLAQMMRDAKNWFGNRLLKIWWLIEATVYAVGIEPLTARPIDLSAHARARRTISSGPTAYYLWHFPVLSQTFINRELAALKQSAIPVEVIADGPEELALADDNARLLLADTCYLEPIDRLRLRRYHRYFVWRHALSYIKCFVFVVMRRYGRYKSRYEDVEVFSRAVYLAGTLVDRNISHIHAPWSDRCAFVAMLAAKLAGITYSVQARAHDIHRTSDLFALPEKFEPAEFIVTNTRYNEAYMRSFLSENHWPKLTVIHNGIDLARFKPPTKTARRGPIKILSVGRLIEQKGHNYLLQALAVLRDQGFGFDCEIVGGTEDIYMNYYLKLKKLHKELGLEERVRFSGAMPFKEVLCKYAESDIFVLPCVIAEDGSRDIIPNAVLEAMAMQLPVISTTVTGLPEIVEDGVSGILVSPNDTASLSDALVQLMDDSDLRHRLGANARARVEDKFDISNNVKGYIELFRRQRDECAVSSAEFCQDPAHG